jgi:ABC-type multidrug transport system permease subunit
MQDAIKAISAAIISALVYLLFWYVTGDENPIKWGHLYVGIWILLSVFLSATFFLILDKDENEV